VSVFQVSVHDDVDGYVSTTITEAKNPREALLKVLESKPGLYDITAVHINNIADAVLL